jgi:hypothetical protein
MFMIAWSAFAVAEPDRIAVIPIGAPQGHDAEEAHTVFRYSEVALYHLVSEVGEAVRRQVDHAMMRDWDMGGRCRRGREFS